MEPRLSMGPSASEGVVYFHSALIVGCTFTWGSTLTTSVAFPKSTYCTEDGDPLLSHLWSRPLDPTSAKKNLIQKVAPSPLVHPLLPAGHPVASRPL